MEDVYGSNICYDDLITLSFGDFYLHSDGFSNTTPLMRTSQLTQPIFCLFVIKRPEQVAKLDTKQLVPFEDTNRLTSLSYGQPFVLQHLLSGYYVGFKKDNENSFQLKLKSDSDTTFVMRPVYRCSKYLMKNLEEMALITDELGDQWLGLSVGLPTQPDSLELPVGLKPNLFSKLKLIRHSSHLVNGQVSNFSFCQLRHIQSGNILENREGTAPQFQGSYRDSDSYVQFIAQKPCQQLVARLQPSMTPTAALYMLKTEHKVHFDEPCYIRFFRSNKFLSFDDNGQPGLRTVPSKRSVFIFQSYQSKEFIYKAMIKVRHEASGLYLCHLVSQGLRLGPFDLYHTMLVEEVPLTHYATRLSISNLCDALQKISQATQLSFKTKKNLRQTLTSIVKLLFGGNTPIQAFSQTDRNFLGRINLQNQMLCSSADLVSSLLRLLRLISANMEDPAIKMPLPEQIVSPLFLALVGTCFSNQTAFTTLVDHIDLLFEWISLFYGTALGLYHIFFNNYDFLLQLEAKQQKIKKKKTVVSMRSFIDAIKNRKFTAKMKLGLFSLLKALIATSDGQRIHAHEKALLQALTCGQLNCLLFPVSISHQGDLSVSFYQGKQAYELEQVGKCYTQFSEELGIFEAQISFLSCLCSGRGQQKLDVFRQYLPQQCILHYLESSLHQSLKNTLIQAFVSVYLQNSGVRKSCQNVILLDVANKPLATQQFDETLRETLLGQSYELTATSGSSGYMDKGDDKKMRIQSLIIELIREKVSNPKVEGSIQMTVRSLQTFLELGLLRAQEETELCTFLLNYVAENIQNILFQPESKGLLESILRLLVQFQQTENSRIVNRIVRRMMSSGDFTTITIVNGLRLESVRSLELFYRNRQLFKTIKEQALIRGDHEVFLEAIHLEEQIRNKPASLFDNLQHKIIVFSESSQGLYNKCLSLFGQLERSLASYDPRNPNVNQRKAKFDELSQLVGRVIYLFFQRSGAASMRSEGTSPSPLVQNMIRQLGLHAVFLQLIGSDGKAQAIGAEFYSSIMQFFSLFVNNNLTNMRLISQSLLVFKGLFLSEDFGQYQLLLQIIQNPKIFVQISDRVYEIVLEGLEICQAPSSCLLMILMEIADTKKYSSQNIYSKIADKLVLNDQLFKTVLKIEGARWHFSGSRDHPSFHEDFVLYQACLFRLLQKLLESSQSTSSLFSALCSKLPLVALKQLFESQQSGGEPLETPSVAMQLMQTEAISLIKRLYLQNDKEASIDVLMNFLQLLIKNITFLDKGRGRNEGMPEHRNESFSETVKTNSYVQICRRQDQRFDLKKIMNQVYFRFTTLYPFFLQILKKMTSLSRGSADKLTEIKLLTNLTVQQCVAFSTKYISTEQFNFYRDEYSEVMAMYEDLAAKRLFEVLHLPASPEEPKAFQGEYDPSKENLPQLLQNYQGLQNLIGCFFRLDSEEQRRLYKGIIQVLQSNEAKFLVQEQRQTWKIVLPLEIYGLVGPSLTQTIQTNPLRSEAVFNSLRILIEDNQDLFKSIKFVSFFKALNFAFNLSKSQDNESEVKEALMLLNQAVQCSVRKKDQIDFGLGDDALLNYISEIVLKFIKKQVCLYASLRAGKHLVSQFQGYVFPYRASPEDLNLTLILEWMQLMADLLSKEHKKVYYQIFAAISQLLKVYVGHIEALCSRLVPTKLQEKIKRCIRILINGLNQETAVMLIEKHLHVELNSLLLLDDSLMTQLSENNLTAQEHFTRSIAAQSNQEACLYIEQLYGYYLTATRHFKMVGNERELSCFILPARRFYKDIKSHVIVLIRSFEVYHFWYQLYQQLEVKTLHKNIEEIYLSHLELMGAYTIASSTPSLKHGKRGTVEAAENLSVRNGAELTAILMGIETQEENKTLEKQFREAKTKESNKQNVTSLFSIIVTIIFFCSKIMFELRRLRSKSKQIPYEQIRSDSLSFFLQKLGRIEVTYNGRRLNYLFFIEPECQFNTVKRKVLLSHFNFDSLQLKIDSMRKTMTQYCLYARNEYSFFCQYYNVVPIRAAAEILPFLKAVSMGLIITANILLIISNGQDVKVVNAAQDLLGDISITIITLILIRFIITMMKELPLVIEQSKQTLDSQTSRYWFYGTRKRGIQLLLRGISVFLHPSIFLNLLIMLSALMILVNDIFLAVLLLEVFSYLSTLRNLLLTLWQPRMNIIHTLLIFVLLQYFFAIIIFLAFRSEMEGFCNRFSDCFYFILVTSSRIAGGFVGYLFLKDDLSNSLSFQLSIFSIFEDFYVLVTFHIFLALLTAIIIDSYAHIRKEEFKTVQNIKNYCIICGTARMQFFLNTKSSFNEHIALQHNIWHYYDFIYSLRHKDYLRTTTERAVAGFKGSQWIPSNMASSSIIEPTHSEGSLQDRQ